MMVFKKKYYLFVENTREFKLDLIKTREKFNIIYRNQNTKEKIQDLFNYRKKCAKYGIKFYVANNTSLVTKLRADGLYISSHNKNLLLIAYIKKGFDIIGSAHNYREIDEKLKQGCKIIIYSRLFETKYSYKKGFLGVPRFNIISFRTRVNLVPLGGINETNLCKLNSVKSDSFACLSVIKKKPAKFINRLF